MFQAQESLLEHRDTRATTPKLVLSKMDKLLGGKLSSKTPGAVEWDTMRSIIDWLQRWSKTTTRTTTTTDSKAFESAPLAWARCIIHKPSFCFFFCMRCVVGATIIMSRTTTRGWRWWLGSIDQCSASKLEKVEQMLTSGRRRRAMQSQARAIDRSIIQTDPPSHPNGLILLYLSM